MKLLSLLLLVSSLFHPVDTHRLRAFSDACKGRYLYSFPNYGMLDTCLREDGRNELIIGKRVFRDVSDTFANSRVSESAINLLSDSLLTPLMWDQELRQCESRVTERLRSDLRDSLKKWVVLNN